MPLRLFGRAIALDRAEQLAIIAVNITALTDLSLRFSDSLIRHRGGILNLASLAGFLPGPGMAVYYASKGYVLSFSEALRQELAPHGVRVTTLRPATEFQVRARVKPGFEHQLLEIAASDVAQAGYLSHMNNKRIVLPRSRHKNNSISAAVVSARVYPGGDRSSPVTKAQLIDRAHISLDCFAITVPASATANGWSHHINPYISRSDLHRRFAEYDDLPAVVQNLLER